MRKQVTISEGQNLFDIAIQEYGSAEGVFELLKENPGLGLNDLLSAGDTLAVNTDNAVNNAVVDLFARQNRKINTTDFPVPQAPTNLVAATGSDVSEIDLSWDDNAITETAYEIWRKQGVSGTYELIDTVAVDEISYTDTGLLDGVQYFYKVRAKGVIGFSSFSDEDDAFTIAPVLRFRTLEAGGSIDVSVTKTGAAAQWRVDYGSLVSGNIQTLSVASGSEVKVFVTDAVSTITDVDLDNCEIIGTVDFSLLTGLNNLTAINNNFVPVWGTWIQAVGVDINVSNSIITLDRLSVIIDDLIVKNGGTTDDDGTDYTGVPGNTFASRTLQVGTLTLDLSVVTNQILYQKVVALGTVGWTISAVKTVCNKMLRLNTLDLYYITTFLEETTELIELERTEGDPLLIKLYDTVANANTGGATGLLATDYFGINDYLSNNAWTPGERGVRVEAADISSQNNISLLSYKGIPSLQRPCGEVFDVLGLSTYGAWSVDRLLQSNYTGPICVLLRESDNQIRAWFPLDTGMVNYDQEPAYDGTAVLPATVSINLHMVNGASSGANTTPTYTVQRTGDIETWRAGSIVRVVAIADQSGNGAHMGQTDTFYQPKLDMTQRSFTERRPWYNAGSSSPDASYIGRWIGAVPFWATGANNPAFTVISKQVPLTSDWGTTGNNSVDRSSISFVCRNPSNRIIELRSFAKDDSGNYSNAITLKSFKPGSLGPGMSKDWTVGLPNIVAGAIDNQETPKAEIYYNGVLEGSTDSIHTDFVGSGYYFSMCTSNHKSNGVSCRNFGVSNIIFYQNKLDANQVIAINNLLNT